MSAAESVAAVAVTADAWHVFAAGRGIDRPAVQIAALIDPEFLAESGWDPARLVLSPPPEHRLLGRSAGSRPTSSGSGMPSTAIPPWTRGTGG